MREREGERRRESSVARSPSNDTGICAGFTARRGPPGHVPHLSSLQVVVVHPMRDDDNKKMADEMMKNNVQIAAFNL